jgi:predicted small integral membrane protein
MRGIVLDFLAVIILAMVISAAFGNGKFYNKCTKFIDAVIQCDTIEAAK